MNYRDVYRMVKTAAQPAMGPATWAQVPDSTIQGKKGYLPQVLARPAFNTANNPARKGAAFGFPWGTRYNSLGELFLGRRNDGYIPHEGTGKVFRPTGLAKHFLKPYRAGGMDGMREQQIQGFINARLGGTSPWQLQNSVNFLRDSSDIQRKHWNQTGKPAPAQKFQQLMNSPKYKKWGESLTPQYRYNNLNQGYRMVNNRRGRDNGYV